ncbi:ras guanine nucleotide exchange factor domain-containing protein [Mycena sp. CBHHK59/15]|nr:ras guanine nucleotide exchange factor domain-containing protein [Mycena sp. CBHHK59/15]
MAAVAAPMYSSHHHAFIPSSSRTTTTVLNTTHTQRQSQQEDMEPLDDQYTTLFCRALYDYEAQDASALSFRQNDIIEVLTQQPSGWWDGLLGDERGWFPSNYVTVISDEEAEMAFSGSELSVPDRQTIDNHTDNNSVLDMSHAMMRGTQAENEEWLDAEIGGSRDGLEELANAALSGPLQSSDFWMPEVTSDGQIYYVNTKTGQHARDLPHEGDGDTSDSDLAGLTSQSSSRSGTSAGLGLANGLPQASRETASAAGFGVLRRTGTPEPWVKKLADDGMSYYYYNKSDRTVQWTRPEPTHTRDRSVPSTARPTATNTNTTPIRATPANTQTAQKISRLSVYSDDSDIQPLDPSVQPNGFHRPLRPPNQVDVVMELTSAERIAQSLQQALAPAPPELVTDLSAIARNSIQAVVENIQSTGMGRRQPDEDRRMDELVSGVVLAVRNLLYVSAAPTGQIPSNVLPPGMRDVKAASAPSPLKPAQRKVTATLSRLVLSARAMQYDAGSTVSETLNRIEVDAEELERAVLSFVLEAQRTQHSAPSNTLDVKPLKRLRGVFMTANVGLGLVGAGAAGSWKGFGWVSLGDDEAPKEVLGTDVVNELDSYSQELDRNFSILEKALRSPDDNSVDLVRSYTQNLIARVSSFLSFASNIHVARHVDIDGIRQDTGPVPNEQYAQTVDKARSLIRTLEVALQSLYDDSTSIFLTAQSLRHVEPGQSSQSRDLSLDHLDALCFAFKSNIGVVNQTFEALLTIGHEQADMAQGDYNGSIDWRMSRLSVIDTQFGGALRPMSPFLAYDSDAQGDMVDMEHAFVGRKGHIPANSYDSRKFQPNENGTLNDEPEPSIDDTMVSPDSPNMKGDYLDASPTMDEEFNKSKSPPRPAGNSKLAKILGADYAATVPTPPEPELPPQPWYLRPTYSPTEILIDPDGTIRGGTVPALVERLTAHEQGDPTFIKAFLMTFKSFTTVDDLFDLLVQRFWIQPPPKLTPTEREEWGKLKQLVIQIRVLNTFKSMVVDDDVLEKDDLFILDRMKEFITTEEVARFPAAKQLLILIERAQKGGDSMIKMVTAPQGVPPPPLVPKSNKKLKLLDIEPLELARQLTIMESQLYQRIRPMECLQRAREQRTENIDNITVVIQTSNKIALWVAESVLSKEDSRRRAGAVKHLISVADRCRTLNNFSTMAAITAGLNTPPIRRLKRTWEQVNQRYMAQFGACEMTIDSNKNFTKYRSMMTSVIPPCVPFIGVFLSTLQFIQDGNPDNLQGNLVNFRKRQKASEVINDIKRWQAPFNFHAIPSIQAYIEESLNSVSDTRESSERFWTISLEREPREREDEKMARLLQESGFL